MGLLAAKNYKTTDATLSAKEGISGVRGTKKKFLYRSAFALAFLLAPFSVAALQSDSTNNMAPETENSSTSIQLEAQSPIVYTPSEVNDTNSTTPNTTTELTVNGQSVPVPDNGSVSQTIPGNNSGTSNQSNVKVDVENHTSSSSDNTDKTDGSSRIRIRSSSDTDVRIRSSSP